MERCTKSNNVDRMGDATLQISFSECTWWNVPTSQPMYQSEMLLKGQHDKYSGSLAATTCSWCPDKNSWILKLKSYLWTPLTLRRYSSDLCRRGAIVNTSCIYFVHCSWCDLAGSVAHDTAKLYTYIGLRFGTLNDDICTMIRQQRRMLSQCHVTPEFACLLANLQGWSGLWGDIHLRCT